MGVAVDVESAVLTPVAEPETEVASAEERGPSGPRIRCPLCGCCAAKTDLWSCTCAHKWNTFDTGGVCPSCLYQWKVTACPSCGEWSPHSDWYGKD